MIRRLLAGALQSEGENLQAIEEYLRILKQDQDNISALNNIAWIYQEEGNSDCVKYGERAYDTAPNRPEVTDTLGWLLVQNGDTNRDLELLQEARMKAPHIPDIHYQIAATLHKAGRNNEARKELDRLLKTGKQFPEPNDVQALHDQLGN